MKRTTNIGGLMKLAQRSEAPATEAPATEGRGVMTTVHLDRRTLLLLQRLAGARRAATRKGRASVSAVVSELIERQRAEIEDEIRRLEADL